MRIGAPVIGLNDSGGARIQEGVESLAGYADIFLRNTLASGVVPQISAIMGPCAGGAVYSPAITDFILMVDEHQLHVHHRARGHQDGDPRGGRQGDARRRRAPTRRKSGVCHFTAPDDRAAHRAGARAALLPALEQHRGPAARADRRDPTDREVPELDTHGPDRPEQALRHAATSSAPSSTTATSSRSHERYAQNIVVGFARIGGRPVGIVANQPQVLAGVPRHRGQRSRPRASCASATASTSRSSPSSTCPASCPGTEQEYGGIITHGAKLLYAFAEATVPKITVITARRTAARTT